MANTEFTRINLKEGATTNYFEALQRTLGGEIDNNSYSLEQGRTSIRMTYYTVIPEFEIMTSNAIHDKALIMDRESDDNPNYLHFYLVKEGEIIQNYNNQQKNVEAGTTKGVFLYNGLFPLVGQYAANVRIKSVGFKFNRLALRKVMPEADPILNTLFDSNDPIAYHTALPTELETLLNDIFHFKQAEFGKTPLVVARGLELFTLLMRSVKKLVDKDELNGLHPDDYKRLLNIKEQLLSSFDQRISVEELASEFGISVSKLKRDFKTLFDTSVYQFYTHAKMDEAYRRLKTGNFSVMEVGYDLGYQNLSKFSQMFKKVKGINPKEVMPV